MKKILLTLFLIIGVANAEDNATKVEVYDPFEGYNRAITVVNSAFYDYIFYPVSWGYDYVMTNPIQEAVSNFFDNLLYPMRLINNLLQGDFSGMWNETKRFALNTTIGFAGFSDAATMHFNIPRSSEDFGQTLGVWGVGSGPHIVWPILGHSNLRDTFGMVGDYFATPVNYIDDDATRFGIKIGDELNEFSQGLKEYKAIKMQEDPYAYSRDMYYLKREKAIKE
ncbi:MAG: VacJ family lipoprotein [Campylobacter sp.]|nr:VacJ family lipoprotein [Campylobacter sp.]